MFQADENSTACIVPGLPPSLWGSLCCTQHPLLPHLRGPLPVIMPCPVPPNHLTPHTCRWQLLLPLTFPAQCNLLFTTMPFCFTTGHIRPHGQIQGIFLSCILLDLRHIWNVNFKFGSSLILILNSLLPCSLTSHQAFLFILHHFPSSLCPPDMHISEYSNLIPMFSLFHIPKVGNPSFLRFPWPPLCLRLQHLELWAVLFSKLQLQEEMQTGNIHLPTSRCPGFQSSASPDWLCLGLLGKG